MKSRRGSETLTSIGIIVICVVGWMAIMTLGGFITKNYYHGFPKTHQGSVIYITHKWNKWGNFNYTDVEMLTYSGDSHHVKFWDHVDLEIGHEYVINTKVEYQWFDLIVGWMDYERVVKITPKPS